MQRGWKCPDESKFIPNHYILYLVTPGQSDSSIKYTCQTLEWEEPRKHSTSSCKLEKRQALDHPNKSQVGNEKSDTDFMTIKDPYQIIPSNCNAVTVAFFRSGRPITDFFGKWYLYLNECYPRCPLTFDKRVVSWKPRQGSFCARQRVSNSWLLYLFFNPPEADEG